MPKIILKTEKRPTKVSDHAISKAVERAYSTRTKRTHAGHNDHAKRLAESAPSQARKRK